MSRTFAPSGTDLHRGWLELVDTDGPFLAVPALKRVWPQGMPQPDTDAVAALKDAKPAFEKAWENWDRRRDDTAARAGQASASRHPAAEGPRLSSRTFLDTRKRW